MNLDFRKLLEDGEVAIRAGHAERLHPQLAAVHAAQIPRSFRLPLANLCRRASLTALGLRFLAPVARPERSRLAEAPASSAELAEYAVLLMRNGSVPEALRLLQTLSVGEVPEVTMYRGFCHQMSWDYVSAARELEFYLKAPANEYSAFVAKVNLASAFVSLGRFAEAEDLLTRGIEEAKIKGYHRLLGNCHELRAQTRLLTGDLIAARSDLHEGERILGAEKSSDQLFLLKWQAILQGMDSNAIAPIRAFREEAVRRRHWESVRECDFFSLKIEFQDDLFAHLLMGTPYASYRERVCRVLGRTLEQKDYIYGQSSGRIFDISSGTFAERALLNPGKGVHRLIAILFRDLYRPTALGGLFSELFPGEHFDVYSSQNRVHQILWRTRSWLKSHAIPFAIEEHSNSYRIVLQGVVGVRITPGVTVAMDSYSVQWTRLAAALGGGKRFKADEACQRLGMSPTSFRRLVKWGLDRGMLERQGQGRSTAFVLRGELAKAA